MKVYVGCFGSGLGHASRMLEMARALGAKGAEVEFSSSGDAARLIEKRGYRCNLLPLADVSYSASGEFQAKESILGSPSILARTYEQLLLEVANMGRFGPDSVLSDSALSTSLAGRVLGVPTFTVLNQLNLTSSQGNKGAPSRLLSAGLSAGMAKLWGLSGRVFLPDLPPPYTISEMSLQGSAVDGAEYVGFLFSSERSAPDAAAVEFARDPRPKVFWQVSGPPRTRSAFLEAALRLGEAESDEFAFVISGGDPSGSRSPRRAGRVWYYEWCDIADCYFRACDVVVSRGGHGTIAQAIASSKPMLLVPIPKQPEQEGNAEKASRLGVAVVHRRDDLTPETLRRSLRALVGGGFRDRSKALGAVAAAYDARSAILSALESAASPARRARR